MKALFWTFVLPAPGRKHRRILNRFLVLKGEITALTPGLDSIAAFYTSYYKMKHDLDSYSADFDALVAHLKCTSDETYEGMLKYRDVETIKQRIEENCYSDTNRGFCHLAPGVSDFTDVKPISILIGGIYGLQKQSLAAWKKTDVEKKTHTTKDSLFASMSDYKLIDYHVAQHMEERRKLLLIVIDRTLKLLQ